jgi:hypothetical protein
MEFLGDYSLEQNRDKCHLASQESAGFSLKGKPTESSGLDHGVPILLELVGENSSTIGTAAAKTAEASGTK